MNIYISIIFLMVLLTILFFIIKRIFFPKKRHQWYIHRAQEIYKRINDNADHYSEAQLIQYIRHINPYVFEELLLYAFERKGFKVIRNRYYSGDGGVDGHVIIDGKRIPIQAKRYRQYIQGKHVASFAMLIKIKKVPYGFFIHTGRTGKASYDPSYESVRIISGSKLVDLLLNRRDFPTWLTKYKTS